MKNLGFKILYIITAIVIIIELGFTVNGSLFTDISKLPQGELTYSSVSPVGDKTLNVYVVKNNLGVAVRGEIKTDDDTYNIFWQTGFDFENAYWQDGQNVIINNIPLDSNDAFGYDCRRGLSLFDEGSLSKHSIKLEN